MFKDKEKKLSGVETETTSSDRYIGKAVEVLEAEVYGLNGKIIDIKAYQARKVSDNITRPAAIVDETSQTITAEIYNLEGLPLPIFVAKLREKRVKQLKNLPPKAV